MAIYDFLGERRSVFHAGRRFVVSGPTVAFGYAVQGRFGTAIKAMVQVWKANPTVFDSDPVGVVLAGLSAYGPGPLAECLAHVVEVPGDPAADVLELLQDRVLAEKVARTCVWQSDPLRLIKSLGFDEPDVDPEPDVAAVDLSDLSVLVAAEKFHIDPMAVMRWPLGVYLTVRDAFAASSNKNNQDSSAAALGIGGVKAVGRW